MATARLHPLPLLLVDFFLLTTPVLAAGTAGKVSDDFFMPIVDLDGPRVAAGAALLASGPGDIFTVRLVLAAGEKSDEAAPSAGDSKADNGASKTPKTEKSTGDSPALKAPAAAKARSRESRVPAKPAGPTEKPQEQEVADGKSPSILQMLEGHEKELLVAGAIALAFFVIGWICGGNYYVRRDRRRRTKLRF